MHATWINTSESFFFSFPLPPLYLALLYIKNKRKGGGGGQSDFKLIWNLPENYYLKSGKWTPCQKGHSAGFPILWSKVLWSLNRENTFGSEGL